LQTPAIQQENVLIINATISEDAPTNAPTKHFEKLHLTACAKLDSTSPKLTPPAYLAHPPAKNAHDSPTTAENALITTILIDLHLIILAAFPAIPLASTASQHLIVLAVFRGKSSKIKNLKSKIQIQIFLSSQINMLFIIKLKIFFFSDFKLFFFSQNVY
jgi:hypothetical protein